MSEKTTSSSSSKVAVAEESLPEEEEAKKTNQGRADKPSTVDEAVQQVSSLFNQRIMNEPFCTQWFEHFRVPKHDDKQLYTDADVTRTIVETVSRKPNATRSSDEKNTSVDDVRTLYTKAIEAHLNGQFRESFQLLRPLLPFLATDPCIWIRLTEACVYELFDATSSYDHIYPRLFQKATRRRPPRRSENQKNDPTVRHPEQNLEFAECTSLVAFTMAQNSNNTQYLIHSSRLAAFVAMKMEKYRNALEIVSWLFRRNSQMELSSEQLATMILYRIESFYHTGEYTKAYTGANQVLKQIRNPRLTTRASMVSVLACLKRYEYTKAFNELKAMLHDEYLDTEMQESAALLGMYLSYTVRSDVMLQKFLKLLQESVY